MYCARLQGIRPCRVTWWVFSRYLSPASEKQYWYCFVSLLYAGPFGGHFLRKWLVHHHQPWPVLWRRQIELSSRLILQQTWSLTWINANYSILNNFLLRRVLNGHQWDKLFPPGGVPPDSNTFDITLLFLLLTKICGLTPPPSGWHTKPPSSDTSHEANLARVKFYRNVLYGHVTTTGVDTPTFSALWPEISGVLLSLGLDQTEVDRLKAEKGGEQDYIDVVIEWANSEEDIKSQLKSNNQSQSKTHQAVEDVRQAQVKTPKTVEDIHQTQAKTQRRVEDIHLRSSVRDITIFIFS